MTNGEKLKAVLNPRANQIRILGDWVEIEIQKLGINFSCGLDWWNAEYEEPTTETLVSLGVYKQVAWEQCMMGVNISTIARCMRKVQKFWN